MSESDSDVLVWHAYEHEHIERESDWYWAVAIVGASVAIISVIFGNFLFAILVVLAFFILAKLAQQRPELTRFELSKKGVRIGNTLHEYAHIVAFHIVKNDEEEDATEPRLLLATNKVMTQLLVIPIRHHEPEVIRAYLKKHLKEMPIREPFGHKVLEYLGM